MSVARKGGKKSRSPHSIAWAGTTGGSPHPRAVASIQQRAAWVDIAYIPRASHAVFRAAPLAFPGGAFARSPFSRPARARGEARQATKGAHGADDGWGRAGAARTRSHAARAGRRDAALRRPRRRRRGRGRGRGGGGGTARDARRAAALVHAGRRRRTAAVPAARRMHQVPMERQWVCPMPQARTVRLEWRRRSELCRRRRRRRDAGGERGRLGAPARGSSSAVGSGTSGASCDSTSQWATSGSAPGSSGYYPLCAHGRRKSLDAGPRG